MVVASYVMMSARLTTAVDASAMLPAVVVVKMPVGMIVICPPVVAIPVGAVIVTMAVVPDTNTICVVGAIVVALATVGATSPVACTPKIFVAVVAVTPMTVVFDPIPTADLPMTMELSLPTAATVAAAPTMVLLLPVVRLLPAVDPMPTLLAPVVTNPSEPAPHAELRVPLVFASSD